MLLENAILEVQLKHAVKEWQDIEFLIIYGKGVQTKVLVLDLFDEFGVENCKIEWVEDCSCNSKKDLEAREGQFQR